MTFNGLLSRDELLEGLPARRASTLLYAIENMTAQLSEEGRKASALYLTYSGAEECERSFLGALAAGRDSTITVSIQELERYAPNWKSLLPEKLDANLSAALANLLAQKYTFTFQSSGNIRAALQLDQANVQESYQRLYGKPLEIVYAPQIRFADRVNWIWAALSARLESLSPFWLAVALTIPAGSGLLALPIALADLGPVAGIIIVIIFGLLNALTAAAFAEAVSRSAITRFGLGYLGQLVTDYLGNAGSVLLSLTLAINNFLILIVFFLGIAGTLAGAIPLPITIWLALIFAVVLYFLSRKSLNKTVAFTLIVVAINVVLLIVIPLMALPGVKAANFTYVNLPLVNGQPFDPGALRLVFGVMLTNYFSHLLIANYGRVVLRRDPSARSWIWGSVTAIAATTLISCLWIIAVNGSISPQILAQQTGTVLEPLKAITGPAVDVLGSILVILSLGIATIHISLGTYYLMQERLPAVWNERNRFLAGVSPILGVFLFAEWMAITGSGSFAGLLGLIGVIALSLLGGIFPVLLLAASRRKSDFVPGVVYRLMGNPILLVMAYLVFWGAILAHGLFIWESFIERAVTVGIGLLVLVSTIMMLRRGLLTPRLVIEIRDDQSGSGASLFAVTANGAALPVQVELKYADGMRRLETANDTLGKFSDLRAAVFQLPVASARELKVWVHKLTPEGTSLGVTARLELQNSAETKIYELDPASGQILLPIDGASCQLRLVFSKQA